MRRAERIVDKDVRDGGKVLRERVLVLRLLRAEPGVFKENHIPVLHPADRRADTVVHHDRARNEFHFLTEQLAEALCHRRKRLGFLVLFCLHLAQMAAENHFPAVRDQFFDRGESRHQTVFVGNLAALQRHVEVAAKKHALSFDIDVIHGFFVQSHFHTSCF